MKYFLFALCMLTQLQPLKSQNATQNCKLEVWKGRKTNFKINKIALYTGRSGDNTATQLYRVKTEKNKVWKKLEGGILCLVEEEKVIKLYTVIDTVKCRDFTLIYDIPEPEIIVEGKKVKTKGLCEENLTPALHKALTTELLSEGLLFEIPNPNFTNWDQLYLIAVQKYQEKYDLGVGGLTMETVKHMKLNY